MCKDCCTESFIHRETVQKSGSYYSNFKECNKCGLRSLIKIKNKQTKGDEYKDDEMEITFDHYCSKCDHKICQHLYTYKLSNGSHRYSMECELCGIGGFIRLKAMWTKMGIEQLLNNVLINGFENSEVLKKPVLHLVYGYVREKFADFMLIPVDIIELLYKYMDKRPPNSEVGEDEWDD